ncbi:RNA polymerase subunit sigma, partial [Ruminococcaceae bacterium OttesenSCG-928-O06]|nr:RNA polymerase subunit sigma [Ruminococcaceae bacterium OttesenSCG-928-O06]
ENADGQRIAADASLAQYSRELERLALSEEISALRQALAGYGVSFDSLAKISPKQKRSKALCIAAARQVATHADMRKAFAQTAKLPLARLAQALGVSPKTIAQHRRYIVTLVVILLGDYPCIRAFLPTAGEVNT